VNLRRIVEQTGASIVLSSSWQATPHQRRQVDSALQANGIPSTASQTVEIPNPRPSSIVRVGKTDTYRAGEIKAWIKRHVQECAAGWVALDDLDLQHFLPTGRFVRMEAEAGLTDRDAEAAIQLLGGPDPAAPPLPPPPHNPGGFNLLVSRGEMQREMLRAALAEC
jgi:hypothetical protein